MKYLLKEGFESFSEIDDDMRQVFHHDFSKNVYKNEIIKMKQEGAITEEDLAVAKLLFSYRFATLEQIFEAISSDKNINAFYARLEKLLKYRIINKFMLTYAYEDKIQNDALMIYCLDIGGHYLLTHFSNDEDLLDWFYIRNLVTSEIVAKSLMTLEVYNSFKRTCPDKLTYFKPSPEMRIGNKTMVPAFELAITQSGQTLYFLGEVVRKQEVSTIFRDKAEKWYQLLKKNTWKKYFGHDSEIPPILLTMAADDVTGLMASRILHETAELDKFRIMTEERVKKPLYEKGAFMKYMPEMRQLKEVKIRNFEPKNFKEE